MVSDRIPSPWIRPLERPATDLTRKIASVVKLPIVSAMVSDRDSVALDSAAGTAGHRPDSENRLCSKTSYCERNGFRQGFRRPGFGRRSGRPPTCLGKSHL